MTSVSRSLRAERRRVAAALDHLEDDPADLGLGLRLTHLRQPLEVQAVQQVVVDPGLHFLVGPQSRVANDGWCDTSTTGFIASSAITGSHVSAASYADRPSIVRLAISVRSDGPAVRLDRWLCRRLTGASVRLRAKPVSAAASLLWLSSTTGRPAFNASSASR